MAYPPLAPSRRSRRRRWLFGALILFIVVALIALAVRYRTEQRAVADYLASVEGVATAQGQAAASFGELVGGIDEIDRPTLMTTLEMLTDEAEQAEAALESVTVPPAVAVAHGYLAVAVASWSEAVSMLDSAVGLVLDKPEDEAGPDLLTQAMTLLEVGDAAYGGFLEAIDAMDASLVTREFHRISFVPDPAVAVLDPGEMTVQLRAVFGLEADRDVSVTGLTDPEPVAFQEGTAIPVIPFSDSFAVNAVVANEGNEVAALVSVDLTVTPSDGGDDAVSLSQTIGELAPGSATTLLFDNIALRPGGRYELVVTATLDGDGDMTNNIWRTRIFRNADS